MLKTLRVATSPLTNTIYAGTTKGDVWGKDKQDVTIDALVAVAHHVENFGKPVVITLADGTPEYRITVERL